MPFVEGVSYHAWPYAEASVTLTVHLETNGYQCNALIGETASWQDSDCGDERLLACQLPKSAW